MSKCRGDVGQWVQTLRGNIRRELWLVVLCTALKLYVICIMLDMIWYIISNIIQCHLQKYRYICLTVLGFMEDFVSVDVILVSFAFTGSCYCSFWNLVSWLSWKKFHVVCEIWAAYGSRYQGYEYVTSCGLVDMYEQYVHTVSIYSATQSHISYVHDACFVL